MKELVLMRLRAYARGQLGLVVPAVALAVVLVLTAGGGGTRDVATATVLVLFPVIAYQAKVVSDQEPAVQTELVTLAVGGLRRQLVALIIAAGVVALPPICLALLLASALGAVRPEEGFATVLGLAVMSHVVTAVPAATIGLWCGRPVSQSAGYRAVGFLGAMVLTLVLDSQHGALAWLAPPLLSSLRLFNGDTGEMATVLLRALLWSAVTLTGYVLVRLAVRLPFRRRIDV